MNWQNLSRWVLVALCGGTVLGTLGSCARGVLENLGPVVVPAILSGVLGGLAGAQ